MRSPRRASSKRRSPRGTATYELIHSCYQGKNDALFAQILSLYVAKSSKIADVTFGKGIFWKKVRKKDYELFATDIASGSDCRNLPYENDSIDCVVFDPPYMHTATTAHRGHQNFEENYRNNATQNGSTKKYHEAVLDLYFQAADEAH